MKNKEPDSKDSAGKAKMVRVMKTARGMLISLESGQSRPVISQILLLSMAAQELSMAALEQSMASQEQSMAA